MEWEDVSNSVRKRLARSHLTGRQRALGHMSVHKHGKSNSQSVLSADGGPHPKAVGTAYTNLF
eukprot:7669576-Prorocentrum_lima.AAC.1